MTHVCVDHSQRSIVLSSPSKTDKREVKTKGRSLAPPILFHLFCLCLPAWVPGFGEDAQGLVADVALLGAVLLAALPVLWCPVLASGNLFDRGDLCSLACSFCAFN